MIYINVIFQLISNGNKYLCFCNYNVLTYYELYKRNDEANINKNDTAKSIIKEHLNKMDAGLHIDSIALMLKYYNTNTIFSDKIEYDIVIDRENNILKMHDKELDYKEIFNANNENDWKGDIYNDDEKEYNLEEYEEEEDYEDHLEIEEYDKRDCTDKHYFMKDIFDISEVENYDNYNDGEKEEIQRRIARNMRERDYINNYNNQECFTKEFMEKMLLDTNEKIKKLDYFIGGIMSNCGDDNSYKHDILTTYASLLCKKYKYSSKNINLLKKLKHNFIVTKLYYDKDYDRNRTYKINIEAKNDDKIHGYYEKTVFVDHHGYVDSTDIDYYIKDIDDPICESLYDYLENRIEWRYIE